MALASVCDVPVRNAPCGKFPTQPLEITIGGKRISGGDICEGHHPEVLAKVRGLLGLTDAKSAATPRAVTRNSSKPAKKATTPKRRKQPELVTASGKKFTAADARGWLVEQGTIPADSKGRIARDKLKLYADAH